jgi:hypothetical protein
MHIDDALQFVDDILTRQGKKRLNDIQRAVFRGSWEDKSYKDIRRLYSLNCDPDYLAKDVGYNLWRDLEAALQIKVSKKNLRGPIELAYSRAATPAISTVAQPNPTSLQNESLQTAPQVVLQEATLLTSLLPSTTSLPWKPATRQDWGTAPDVSSFYGRESELQEFVQWITLGNCRLLAIVGLAGTGKTFLSVRLAQEIREQFECLVWRSLSHTTGSAPTLEALVTDLVQFISNYQESSARLPQLMHYLRNQSCLIVLDGFEEVLMSKVHNGSFLPGYEDYQDLLQQISETSHQSRVILTSREKPKQIARLEGETNPVRAYKLSGIGEKGGLNILAAKGAIRDMDRDWLALFQRCDGHPYALSVLATRIWEAFGGRVNDFLAYDSILSEEISDLLQQQVDRLSDLEKTILECVAAYAEPVELEDILQRLTVPLSRLQVIDGLQSLRRRSLIEGDSRSWLHPLVMAFLNRR